MYKKLIIGGILAALISGAAFAQSLLPYFPKGPIESKYSATGPWGTVGVTTTTEPCDREGNLCDVFYPTALGTNPIKHLSRGFRHPVIVWGNGSADTPVPQEAYATLLRHWASWGFIVIKTRDGATGQGETMIDTANYIIGADNDPHSIFHNMVDPDNIGATGHSQGGGSTMVLFAQQNELFKTFVGIHPAAQAFADGCKCSTSLESLGTPTRGSIFYIGGALDPIGNADMVSGYYLATNNAVNKVGGVITGTSHLDVQGDPDCGSPTLCFTGVKPYLGYTTAWFMWKLQGAADGPAAFNKFGEFTRP
ncbi:MAG TPA: hypothetical protein VJQ78_12305, partial [Sphingobium sp.]|nr:hypothetical protein [Sphingobium sp.]